MSDFSPTLVLQKSIAKTPNDMAKVQIKSEEVTSFGGFFPIMEQFDALLAQTIDSTLGMRCKWYGLCFQVTKVSHPKIMGQK